jgi:hypothetical protein
VFRWHINPSSRPIVEKDRGREATGDPSPPQDIGPTTVTVPCTPLLVCGAGNDDQTFTVPTGPGIDNAKLRIRIQWTTAASDYDLKIYRPGADPLDQSPIVQSNQRGTDFEEIALLEPEGEYLIRVANVAGAEPWTGQIIYEGPDPIQKGRTEEWNLTCEVGGDVVSRTFVLIARGEVKQPDLGACDRRPRAAVPGPVTTTPPPAGTTPPSPPATSCTPARGFRSAAARPRGRRVAFRFTRTAERPVNVDVFKQTTGRRVSGDILVARYTGRVRSFTWNGRANRRGRSVRNGYYFVRFRMRLADGSLDVRRIALQRKGGRFRLRPTFYHRESCGLLRWFRATRPVFGGRTKRGMSLSYRLNAGGRVAVTVRRGGRVVRRFAARDSAPARTYRLRLRSRGLRAGDYVATLVARSGGGTARKRVTVRLL